MTDTHSRFAEFVKQCVAALELPTPSLTEDRFMFKVGDRWVELKYHPSDDRVTFAALVYMRSPEGSVRADLLASFNVYNLFNGGYCLVNPDGDGIVYLCQPHRLAALSARDIRQELERFATRAAAAGTWYMTQLESAPSEDAAPRSEFPQQHSFPQP